MKLHTPREGPRRSVREGERFSFLLKKATGQSERDSSNLLALEGAGDMQVN